MRCARAEFRQEPLARQCVSRREAAMQMLADEVIE
jgi:hypothetical protein